MKCLHCLAIVAALDVRELGQSCQDIDRSACELMAVQNPNMCSDPVLSRSACPKYCRTCPLTCYNCTVATHDVSSCNTALCESDQVCTTVNVRTSNGQNQYNLACGEQSVCNLPKRSLQSRYTSIECCQSDFCNRPMMTTTPEAVTTITPEVTTQAQWLHWSAWGTCIIEPTSSKMGTQNRSRLCNNGCHSGTLDTQYRICPYLCIPATIVDIKVNGTWKINGHVHVTCLATGYPKPRVQLFAHQGHNSHATDPSTIIVGPITSSHDGQYKCDASNQCGGATRVMDLHPPSLDFIG